MLEEGTLKAMLAIRKHSLNLILLSVSIGLLVYGMWQHECTVIDWVWGSGQGWKNPFYFWYPYLGTNLGMAYDITMALEIIAYIMLFLSLWFWTD